jgi:hypothetical protein
MIRRILDTLAARLGYVRAEPAPVSMFTRAVIIHGPPSTWEAWIQVRVPSSAVAFIRGLLTSYDVSFEEREWPSSDVN